MKCAWLRRNKAERLLIAALGWGQDAADWADAPWPEDRDVLALYCWDDPAPLPEPTGYREHELLAWSFGVRQAATLAWPVRFRRAVAVNGTLHPVDDRRGIPEAIFAGTLNLWRPGVTAAKFWRRMAPGAGKTPTRSDDSLLAELRFFAAEFAEDRPFLLNYDRAVIGTLDRIFPPENQLCAWREAGVPILRLDLPHDPGARMAELPDLD